MSTADSCLMASSGNFVNDLLQRLIKRQLSDKAAIRISQLATLIIGVVAVVLAGSFQTVLDGILYAYAFMVAGLFIPTLGAYFWGGRSPAGARMGMLAGGILTLLLIIWDIPLRFDLDPAFYGIVASLIGFVLGSRLFPETSPESAAAVTARTQARSPAADQ
jgi:SSS family solute:Na+ symporter